MAGYFTLDEQGQIVPCSDVLSWAKWKESTDIRVALDVVGSVKVSTVFLGLDHNFEERGLPLLWETCLFPGDVHERYVSRTEAEKGHADAVAEIEEKEGLTLNLTLIEKQEKEHGTSTVSIEVPDEIFIRVLESFRERTGISPAKNVRGKFVLYRDGERLRDPVELKKYEADIYHAICAALAEVHDG